MWATRSKYAVRRVLEAEDGSALTGFALVLPVLLVLTFGVIESTLLLMDYARAEQAVRHGTRSAIVQSPVGDISDLSAGDIITCGTTGGGGVTCSGAAVDSAASFATIVSDMQDIFPDIQAANVQVVYTFSGIGDVDQPGGAIPFITVRLRDFSHRFFVLDRFADGLSASVGFPTFETTMLGNGASTTSP